MGQKSREERRSPCPVACALDIIGDRWTLLVIRDLVLGRHRFDEFLESPEGIATNILSQRLRWLVQQGLVDRTPDPHDGRKVIYTLTKKGTGLRRVLKSVADWGLEACEGTAMHPDFAKKRT